VCEEKTRSSSSFSVAGVGAATHLCVRTSLTHTTLFTFGKGSTIIRKKNESKSYLVSDIFSVIIILLTLYSLIIITFLCYLYVSLRI